MEEAEAFDFSKTEGGTHLMIICIIQGLMIRERERKGGREREREREGERGRGRGREREGRECNGDEWWMMDENLCRYPVESIYLRVYPFNILSYINTNGFTVY